MAIFRDSQGGPRLVRIVAPAVLALVLLLLFAVYYRAAVRADIPLLDGDDAVYLLMADHYSSEDARPRELTALVMRHSYFPPLYPLTLAAFGAHSLDTADAHLVTVLTLLAAMGVYFFWAAAVLGSRVLALSLLVVFATAPTTVFQSLRLLSENLYLLLTLVTLLCATKAQGGTGRWALAGAGTVGLAVVTRSAGMVMLCAYVIWLASLARPSRLHRIGLASLAALPGALWAVWQRAQNHQIDYLDAVLETLGAKGVVGLLDQQLTQAPADIWHAWLFGLHHLPSSGGAQTGAALVGILCLVGAAWRTRQKHIDGYYSLLYLLVLLFWPWSYDARRFLYVLLPIAFVQGMYGLSALAHRHRRSVLAPWAPYALLAVIVATTLPASFEVAYRFALSQQKQYSPYAVTEAWYSYADLEKARARALEQRGLVSAWMRLAEHVPDDECIYHVKPVPLMLYANRRSYATPLTDDSRGASYLTQATLCRYYYVGAYVYPPYRKAFYPLELLGAAAQVVNVDVLNTSDAPRILGILLRVERSAAPEPYDDQLHPPA